VVRAGLRQARQFGKTNAASSSPDETIEITIVKRNGALNGFNQWTLNGGSFLDGDQEADVQGE
jgi:hypothetical protein